jgi:hypothetical protein
MAFTALPSYTVCDMELSYEPSYSLTALSWFNLARCARARMTEYSSDIHRWRGERRSFYSSLQAMDVDGVSFMD